MTSRRRADRGAAAVEFALIAPLFIALLFGIISYGYMLSFRQGISQAAAEGGRVFAVAPAGAPTTKAQAIEAINLSLESYGVTCTTSGSLTKDGAAVGTCTVPSSPTACPNDTGAKCVKVTIDYAYRSNPLIPSFPGLGITLPENLTYATTVQVNQ